MTLHIEFLLRRHDCVILPGLGAFIVSQRAAYVNEEWGFVTPPSREVHFNPSINNNDGLLANSYARKNKITFEAANACVLSDIAELKSVLKSDGEVSVGRVGILCDGEDNTVYFTPYRKNSIDSAFWGLQPVRLVSKKTEEANKHLHESAEISSGRKSNCYYIPINKTVARIAAIFIVAVMALFSVSFPPAGTSDGSDLASIVPVPKVMAKSEVKVSSKVPSPEKSAIDSVAEKKDSYFLIVASLRSEKEAQKFISAHSNSRFTLQCETTRSMSRVYAAKSNDKAELYKMLNSEEFKAEYTEAWVWHP